MDKYCIKDYLAYPVRYSFDKEAGVYTAYFRDFDTSTQADEEKDLKRVAEDFLVLSGMVNPRNHEMIPAATKPEDGEEVISISPTLALKFILRNAMTSKNLRPADLARLMGMSTQSVAALLDVYRTGTRFDALYRALEACSAEVTVNL